MVSESAVEARINRFVSGDIEEDVCTLFAEMIPFLSSTLIRLSMYSISQSLVRDPDLVRVGLDHVHGIGFLQLR